MITPAQKKSIHDSLNLLKDRNPDGPDEAQSILGETPAGKWLLSLSLFDVLQAVTVNDLLKLLSQQEQTRGGDKT